MKIIIPWMNEIVNVNCLKFKTKSGNIIMNHYQDQTKKKPLIVYPKMKYNQSTIHIKDKIKKDKSLEKQNIYETQNKKFKDFNASKYSNQYQTQYNGQIFKKPNPTQGVPLTPRNVEMTNNIPNKNLTFGFVKNNQPNQRNYNTNINNDQQTTQTNPIISVNVNIQNMPQNAGDFKKIYTNKIQIKTANMKRNLQLQKTSQQGSSNNDKTLTSDLKTLKIDDQKRKFNTSGLNTTERYMERPSMIDRTNIDRVNERNQKKEKFKKNLHQKKYHMTTSPATVDQSFMCDEELQVKPIETKHQLYQKKLSQKKLSIPQLSQMSAQINTHAQGPLISTQQRYAKKPEKIDKKNVEKELKQFEAKEDQINSIQCSESIGVLFTQQQEYMVDPTYLQKNQKSINWTIRAILIDWMRQLSHQYALKRDTYHLAVVLLDSFLEKKPNIQKQFAQVIGATTLFIASKLEELECRPSQSFAESTQGICTNKDIQMLQLEICKTLQFKLNPPTIFSLANRIMMQWDKYIEESDYAKHHPCFQNRDKPYFKKLDNNSYKMFRQLLQFIDCVILDIQTAQYKPILIVLSLMYLIIGVKLAGFTYEEIHQVFPRVSHYLLDQTSYFNDLFLNFVLSSFGMNLMEILPSVQYTASYFNLTLTYEKPLLGDNENELEQMELQEYCSYQTYNRHMLKTATSRFRGILNTF